MPSGTWLYYYGARYYEPQLSKWMSADPAGFGLINPMDSNGKPRSNYSIVEATNWYSYVSNNPVRYADPTGMESADAAYSWLQNFKDAPDFKPQDKPVTSEAGPRPPIETDAGSTSSIHKGIDYAPTPGHETSSFVAAADGEVARSGDGPMAGQYIVLDHGDGWESKYFHMDIPTMFRNGDDIKSGQTIGVMGRSGAATGIHLHFEIRKDGEAIDPNVFFDRSRVMFGE